MIPATLALLSAAVDRRLLGQKGNRASARPPVLVAQAVETNVPVQIEPPPVGHVMPISTVTIHSQIGGMISQIHFKEGQEVKKGDPLFTIDPRPSQAALDQARANLERDSGQLEYQKANYDARPKIARRKNYFAGSIRHGHASRDAALGTVAADRAAITNAVLNLNYCDIRAPFDGKTGSLQSYEGNVVKAPDDTLLTINQIHPIYVEFAVPEQYLPEIQKQMRGKTLAVQVTFENMDGTPPQGELTFVDNSVDMTTGTILRRRLFKMKTTRSGRGNLCRSSLTLSELTNAVVVPSQAVQVGQNGQFIYVVKPDQTVECSAGENRNHFQESNRRERWLESRRNSRHRRAVAARAGRESHGQKFR